MVRGFVGNDTGSDTDIGSGNSAGNSTGNSTGNSAAGDTGERAGSTQEFDHSPDSGIMPGRSWWNVVLGHGTSAWLRPPLIFSPG
jgi:hypothetical protein